VRKSVCNYYCDEVRSRIFLCAREKFHNWDSREIEYLDENISPHGVRETEVA